MHITLNNRKETIEREEITMAELIEYKKFKFKLLVTKINGELVRKDERASAKIKDGDNVVVMHMISGG